MTSYCQYHEELETFTFDVLKEPKVYKTHIERWVVLACGRKQTIVRPKENS